MTSLIAWTAVDQRGPSAIYFASDSRFVGQNGRWDFGKKLFACNNSPNVFAYCGAVLFPTHILGQLVCAIDSGLLFREDDQPETKFETIATEIEKSLRGFPEVPKSFSVAFATRHSSGIHCARFFVATLTWSQPAGFSKKSYSMPQNSNLLFALGSGAKTAENFHGSWKKCDVGGTSRAVFSAFCDAIESGDDPNSGGAPQLVGIYRREVSKEFGLIHNGSCYVNGMVVSPSAVCEIEFRNRLFERCGIDGSTIGQKHFRPDLR